MSYSNGHVMTLANSIIGVSILAMPYCFKQCGIILSVLILLISSVISRLACHFLLKSAIIARRKTFEFLAFHIFGTLGKFAVEIGMIGFLLGTCIAFFVVMGDLGPEIVSEMTGVRAGNALRNGILVALAVFCVLPLGLLRNIDSLNGVSKATIGFYCCLVLKIIVEALPHIFSGDWVSEVILWRPAGILQCLPIFSMALFCQTQLFEVYEAIPNASLEKMNSLIRVAVNICTCVYIFVGAFGYIAFFQKPFMGNILLSFRPSAMSDVMKIGFVMSLAFSFPLVIFPCRQSLYSLLYKGPSYTALHETAPTNYIPEGKFKLLTLVIVSVSLIIGILIPNIELVLGLVGSTIGVMICVLFPVTCFICVSPKNTNERILAQLMLFIGVIVMVLGTYANLYAFEEAKLNLATEGIIEKQEILIQPKVENKVPVDIPTTLKSIVEDIQQVENKVENNSANKEGVKEVRHEPPQPEEPVENQAPSKSPDPPAVEEKSQNVVKPTEQVKVKQDPVTEVVLPPGDVKEIPPQEVKNSNDRQEPVVEPVQPQEDVVVKTVEEKPIVNALNAQPQKPEIKKIDDVKKEIPQKPDEVDEEAIKKEETELKEQEKEKAKETQDTNKILIDTIQRQNEFQKEIVEQQKKLIEVIQKQQEIVKSPDINIVNEEKLKAVKQIERIAKKAIESISGQDQKISNKASAGNENITKVVADQVKQEIQNSINNKNVTNKLQMVPLPIVLAEANKKDNDLKKENKEIVTSKTADEDIKEIRRDILSEKRTKREINDKTDEYNKLNKAVKEVCEEYSKLPSTEKPIIKMLCQLSEPELAQIDLKTFAAENKIEIKPLKADLK